MNWRKTIVCVLQVILGAVFVFSGFVKAVDPWGTAIKLKEYFAAFGMDWLSVLDFPIAFALPALELAIGIALIAGVARRVAVIAALCFMLFFTVLTFVLALWNPVADCGCFGDAVKLTNWQTFGKNLLLLLFAGVVFRRSAKTMPKRRDWVLSGIFILAGLCFASYNYRHLPVIDFLPYKVGTDLRAGMNARPEGNNKVTLIYRDKTDGALREFAIEDPEWQDTLRWEFVDTRVEGAAGVTGPNVRDFAVFDSHGDITAELLADTGRVWMIVADRPALKAKCAAALATVASEALSHSEMVICVTSAPLDTDGSGVPSLLGIRNMVSIGDQRVPAFNMDAATLSSVLRAHSGVVVLHDGVIEGKASCPDAARLLRSISSHR